MNNQIAAIKATVDCRDVVEADLGQPANTTQKWTKWLCPFHGDTNASFGVTQDGYKCFGCGEKGDVIDWIQKRRGVTLSEAIRILGRNINIGASVEYAKQRAERLAEEIEKSKQALNQLREAKLWLHYHECMGEAGRKAWHDRGLKDWIIDFWKLGYRETSPWNSSTISIPVWGHKWEVQQIKHRLLHPNGSGKYRSEKSGIPAKPFVCNPDENQGELLMVEGEIKAQVTWQEMSSIFQVAGLPSKSTNNDMLGIFEDYDPITICLDPNATEEAYAVGRYYSQSGHDVKVVELPGKIDDLFLAGALDLRTMRQLMDNGRVITC